MSQPGCTDVESSPLFQQLFATSESRYTGINQLAYTMRHEAKIKSQQ